MSACIVCRILKVILLLIIICSGQPASAGDNWSERAEYLRGKIREILFIPSDPYPLSAQIHRTITAHEYRIESVSYASEPFSRVTALLYIPVKISPPFPVVVVACGHGGSKSAFYAQYAGQLYAKYGFACLVVDTIGEEERHSEGKMGTRSHDLHHLGDENPVFVREKLKRLIGGKIVLDIIRGIDYLQTRREIDTEKIGLMGYSMGGAIGGCVSIIDTRIKAAVLCGWVFSHRFAVRDKYCQRMMYAEFNKIMRFDEMTALLAPHAAALFMCGMEDDVIDKVEKGRANVRDLEQNIEGAGRILKKEGINGTIEKQLFPNAGHRPYFLSADALRWMQTCLQDETQRLPVPEESIKFGEWVDGQGQQIEKLYNTEHRERGLHIVPCGAVYYAPKKLACFPDRDVPDPIYTFKGWMNAIAK